MYRTVVQTGLKKASGDSKEIHVYTLDLDEFVNAVTYRMLAMRKHLEEKRVEVEDSVLHCVKCKININKLDVATLAFNGASYLCHICQSPLAGINAQEELERIDALLGRMDSQLQPLWDMRTEVLASALEENLTYVLVYMLAIS